MRNLDNRSLRERSRQKWQPTEYNTVIISHAGCADGVAAAWVFADAIMRMDKNPKCVFAWEKLVAPIYIHFTSERIFTNDKYMPELMGKNVFIVDYSYPVDILKEIAAKCAKLHIWDHHETFSINLEVSKNQIPDNIDVVSDLSKCGAEIAWKEINGDMPPPWFIKHIRDRDLWRWEEPDCHPKSRAFSAEFFSQGIFIETLISLSKFDNYQQDAFYKRGERLLDIEKEIVNRICCKAERALLYFPYAKSKTQMKVPIHVITINTPIMHSDIGNILVKRQQEWYKNAIRKYQNADARANTEIPKKIEISIVYRYSMEEGCWWISLRSDIKLGPNVAAIAEAFGGGGHPSAAGFAYKGDIGNILKYNGPRKTHAGDQP